MKGKRRYLSLAIALVYLVTLLLPLTGCSGGKKAQDTAAPANTPAAEATPPATPAGMPLTEALFWAQEPDSTSVAVPYEPTTVNAAVPGYSIAKDMSNIENLNQFGTFTKEQKQMLAQNGFVVVPSKQEQLFYIYENNEYLKVPSFVTTDSVLQVYHVFYDYSLRMLEGDKLLGEVTALTDSMLDKSIALYNRIKNDKLKEIQVKNIAYFGVAKLAMGGELPQGTPDAAKQLAQQEFGKLKAQSGIEQSSIFPFQLDYTQYKPRGHYTRSEELEKYFKAMMWYGQAPFPLFKKNGERDESQALQALLMTYSLLSENGDDAMRWKKIYEPTAFYVGSTDDLNVFDYQKLLKKVYGEKPDANMLDDKAHLDQFYEEVKKLPEPAIVPKYTTVTIPAGKQFRFMGQRYVADSEILQEMVDPIKRPVPKGLDLMGVLGSDRAYDLLTNTYGENKAWDGYDKAFNRMKNKFGKLEESRWKSNMYFGWLWVIKGFLKNYGEGYPQFMQTQAWQDKSLATALGSWSELRHDTVLYAKGMAAECGGGEEPPKVKGYVEPNIEVYEKLLWLTRYSRENLKEKGLLDGELESKMEQFEGLLSFLVKCSAKELQNEELTQDEYYQLLTYGGWLENLTTSFIEGAYKWAQITSDTDKNMALISDIHTVPSGGVLEVGVGTAYEIYTIVPIGGKLYMTRGAVFGYYEFMNKTRMTDEEWQKQLKQNKQPAQQEWMKTFMDRAPKKEVPVPAEPYSSGC